MNFEIRNTNKNDYDAIDNLTREAFWNIYKPGCDEHLVVHNMHKDMKFIKELDFVAVKDDKIVGHIIFTKGKIDNLENDRLITFGPFSVDPQYQNQGIGHKLIEMSLKEAAKLGYGAVIITGNPDYYSKFGFSPAFNYDIHMDGIPANEEAPFFMVKELKEGTLNNIKGNYIFDSVYFVDPKDVDEFDKNFPPKVKEVREGQL